MPTLSYPGVYIEEVSSGVRPITTASTSTPAFVGVAAAGPLCRATRVTNWTEFQRIFGSFMPGSYLAYSVFAFFNNGGQQCYVVRVASDVKTASVTLQHRGGGQAGGVHLSAYSPGIWGNKLYVAVNDGTNLPTNEFKLAVYRLNELPEQFDDAAPVEVYDNLSMNPVAANYAPTVVGRLSKLIKLELVAGGPAPAAGTHLGGEIDTANFSALGEDLLLEINIDHDGFQQVALPKSIAAESNLAKIAAQLQKVVAALPVRQTGRTNEQAYKNFKCVAEGSRLRLTSGASGASSAVHIRGTASQSAAKKLRLGSANGGVSTDAAAALMPAKVSLTQLGVTPTTAPILASQLGDDGALTLGPADWDAGFHALDTVTDFSLLAAPGIATPEITVQGLGYCQSRSLQDVFFLGELPAEIEPAEIESKFLTTLTASSYGALYYPWLKGLDMAAIGQAAEPILLPPSGFVAGLYARIDARRGVWKAPAGVEATVSGVVGLAYDLTDVRQGKLNELKVNCFRRFPGAGIVAWGARTYSADPEWRYVPVRRTAIMLRVSLYNGLQWAVFEPNDEELWAQIRMNVTAFMLTLFRRGAFQGATPSQAFFVKCDRETNPQEEVDQGIVNLLVGFAPLKPAEFVVVKISQKAGQKA